jgi:hypothetical protein
MIKQILRTTPKPTNDVKALRSTDLLSGNQGKPTPS